MPAQVVAVRPSAILVGAPAFSRQRPARKNIILLQWVEWHKLEKPNALVDFAASRSTSR
jgi:hypothetical protein